MPYLKIWVHTVWATKERHNFLSKDIMQNVIDHIIEYAKTKDIHISQINGYQNHIHCLISMNSDQNIATIMNLLKGESSFWINKNKLTKTKFGWQDEYFAVSIGQSQLEVVKKYIKNQEEHHKKVTFQQEYDEFIKKYDFDDLKG